jgi:hypothetical protein
MSQKLADKRGRRPYRTVRPDIEIAHDAKLKPIIKVAGEIGFPPTLSFESGQLKHVGISVRRISCKPEETENCIPHRQLL